VADIVLAADALAVAHAISGTLDSYDASTTYTVTINGKAISSVGTGGTTSTTATALRALLNASTIPEFAEITWGGSTNAITGTCDTTGKSIVAALTVSGGTGTVTDFADTTAAAGPEVLVAGNCKNASSGARALPTNSDTFTIEDLATDLKYKLNACSGVTVAGLYIESSMTGQVGLPLLNEDAATTYHEHRPRYLAIGATEAIIGAGSGDGSGLVMVDFGSVQTACSVLTSDTPLVDGYHAVILKGTHASNTLTVQGGTVDVAPFAGEVSTLLTLTVTGTGEVRTSSGVTLGTVNAGGQAVVDITSADGLTDITAINVFESAQVTLRGTNDVTAATIAGDGTTTPTLFVACSGTGVVFTTINLYKGAVLDLDACPGVVTATTINVYGECTINDRNEKLKVTNAVAGWSLVTYNGSSKRSLSVENP
jgi:hypothetical protein